MNFLAVKRTQEDVSCDTKVENRALLRYWKTLKEMIRCRPYVMLL